MTAKLELFEVQLLVHLTREHPRYGEYEFGILVIWLYCPNEKTAADNGKKLASLLPYKIGPGKSFPITEGKQLQPYQIGCVATAKIIGGNIAFFHYPKEADEKKVMGHWPLLVPPLPAGIG